VLFLFSFSSVSIFAQNCPTVDGDPVDWPAIFSNASYTSKTLIRDANKSNDNQFTGGSKDVSLISGWTWSNGSTNNKGDISTAGAVLCLTGTDKNISFFGDRVSTNGDADIGFWFFRSAVAPVGATGGGFSGVHSIGDLLVLVHFTNGGVQPTSRVFEWVGSGGSDGPLDSLAPGTTVAKVNSSPKTVPLVTFNGNTWGYVSTTYPANAFFEGKVDLTQANVDPCFSSFLVETRNSQSVTASLQDFVTGVFNTTPPAPPTTGDSRCGPGVVNLSASGCTGGTLKWYDAATGGNLVNSGPTFSPNLTATTTYYVACNVGGCEGPRSSVIGTIKTVPDAPDVTYNAPACDASTFSVTINNVPASGASYSIVDKNGNAIAGVSPASPHSATSNFSFSNIPAGSGFKIIGTSTDGCPSTPNTCGTASALTNQQSSSLVTQKQESPKVLAAPNPFNDKIRFSFQSPVSGKGSLELYTLMGQKVATVYQGNVQQGQVQTIN